MYSTCISLLTISLESILDAYSLTFQSLKKCVLVSTEVCILEENHDTQRHLYFQLQTKSKTFPYLAP